mmetsp:Transcript_5440/g.12771  ORF Transcript_5440/g.12771 Transcript_5440/m.12771 type:complete len:234 (-) Transcript_5440:1451-2152(-)
MAFRQGVQISVKASLLLLHFLGLSLYLLLVVLQLLCGADEVRLRVGHRPLELFNLSTPKLHSCVSFILERLYFLCEVPDSLRALLHLPLPLAPLLDQRLFVIGFEVINLRLQRTRAFLDSQLQILLQLLEFLVLVNHLLLHRLIVGGQSITLLVCLVDLGLELAGMGLLSRPLRFPLCVRGLKGSFGILDLLSKILVLLLCLLPQSPLLIPLLRVSLDELLLLSICFGHQLLP